MGKDIGAVKKIGQRIADLLQEPPARAPLGRASSRRANLLDRSGPADARQTLEFVRAALGEQTELAIGRVNFVNLDGIKNRLGDRWPRVADRIDGIVRRAIERRLEPHDLYTPLPGNRYLVTFGRLSPADAALKIAMIGDEISRLLTGGDLEGETLEVSTAVAKVDGSLDFQEVPSVQEMMEQMYAVSDPGETEPPVAEEFGDDTAEDDALKNVHLVYRPAWDVRRNVVSTFFYVPAVASGPSLEIGKAAIARIGEPQVLRALDFNTLVAALTDLGRLAESRRKLLLGIPLHFESVATTSRLNEYINLCRAVPSDLQQLLIFELVDVPVGVPQSRLFELTSILKRYGRSVLLRLPLVGPNFRPANESGVQVVGTSLIGLRMGERNIMRAFDRFCEGAQKAGLQTYVHGLRTLSLTTAAISSGFDYIDGDIVMSVVDEPGGIYRFDARTMIRNWSRRRI